MVLGTSGPPFLILLTFASSTFWHTGRGNIDAVIHSFNPFIYEFKTDLPSASYVPGTTPELLGCSGGQSQALPPWSLHSSEEEQRPARSQWKCHGGKNHVKRRDSGWKKTVFHRSGWKDFLWEVTFMHWNEWRGQEKDTFKRRAFQAEGRVSEKSLRLRPLVESRGSQALAGCIRLTEKAWKHVTILGLHNFRA